MLPEYPCRAEDTAWRTVDGEMIVVSARNGGIISLNATGALVWELGDGTRSTESIVGAVCDAFEVEPDEARNDVLSFLGVLATEGLLKIASEEALPS